MGYKREGGRVRERVGRERERRGGGGGERERGGGNWSFPRDMYIYLLLRAGGILPFKNPMRTGQEKKRNSRTWQDA